MSLKLELEPETTEEIKEKISNLIATAIDLALKPYGIVIKTLDDTINISIPLEYVLGLKELTVNQEET